MKNIELVFIPSPGLGHLISTVETAKLLLDRDERLSIIVLIMKLSDNQVVDCYTHNISSNPNTTKRLRFINLPNQDETSISTNFLFDIIDNQITNIREIVSGLITNPSELGSRVAGLVLDMFCTKFIEGIADEFNLPSYVFFTSSAGFLGLTQFLVSLKYKHNQELTQFNNSDAELCVPCFSTPVPAKVLPAVILKESHIATMFLEGLKRIKQANGVMINTFYELEPFAIGALGDTKTLGVIYPIGPILNLSSDETSRSAYDDIKKWLDDQPENSVVFLCFGSMGSFEEAQVKQIALALEDSGKKFLWSLRKQGVKGIMSIPTEYEDFQEVLPQGFLERTEGIGKVIGWAPQVAVLSHPSVGGFVSHCGWNSVLESVWFGVPMATFPLYSEQHMNAFELVKELEMAVAVRIEYHMHDSRDGEQQEIVGAEEIEAAIRRLMAEEGGNGVRQKVNEMKEKSRMALMKGGSSYNALNLFIEDVIRNIT